MPYLAIVLSLSHCITPIDEKPLATVDKLSKLCFESCESKVNQNMNI